MDWELEVGVVIGKEVPGVQGLTAKDAEEHIFGFVILNDWSGTCSFFASRLSLQSLEYANLPKLEISKLSKWSPSDRSTASHLGRVSRLGL